MSSEKKQVLLHCCCAPCTLIPLHSLQSDGWDVLPFYYNPNIYPEEEYDLRLHTLKKYLDSYNLTLIMGEYDHESWEKQVGVHGGPYPLISGASNYNSMREARKKRCTACYNLRFDVSAQYSKGLGLEQFDTTLSISPYQFTDEIHKELRSSATAVGIKALGLNWSEFYSKATQKSRDLGMYRQKYCGCEYSIEEAKIERQARKDAAKRARSTNT